MFLTKVSKKMTRIERKTVKDSTPVNPNVRVNPALEKRIAVLENSGNIHETFRPDEIRELKAMGAKEYLDYLYSLRDTSGGSEE